MPRLELTQENREFSVSTPLGEDVLLFHSMSASEELGRLFRFDLALLSTDPQIAINDILGQNATVKYNISGDETRYFNGFVTQFRQSGSHGNLFSYQATISPWLWFLTRTADCRSFQKMTVPDIMKQIFRDYGFSDFEESLSGNYREWEYCNQYRETDFNFVSRLMEQEGIYYYFKHEDGKHVLVLSDSIGAHDVVPGYEEVPFYPQAESVRRERDHIYDWSLQQTIQPGLYALNDFDFEMPKANLQVKAPVQREHEFADFEIYDYPGEYGKTDEGDSYVRARIEELQAQYEKTQGEGTVSGLMTGCLFSLVYHPREDQNKEYLVTAASYNMGPQEYESSAASEDGMTFTCSVSAIDKNQAFRSQRITPKPVVQGPQTAVVVGPSGENIWTDKYGRIKVQFHWDRYGKLDENSSCWVRVSQNRAGKGWGEMYIPHVGQEVIVSFLEGDPDRPIVTGRVYNADNMPPMELPANKSMVAMRDHGGSEMVMQGEDGGQRITMFSPTGEARFSMGAGFNPQPGFHWETADNWVADVGTNQKVDVKGTRETKVIGTSDEIVNGAYSLTVNNTRDVTVTGNETETMGGDVTIRITGKKDEKVGQKDYWNVGNEKKGVAGLTQETFVGMKTSESLAATHEAFVGVKVATNAAAEMSLATGIKIEKSKTKKLLEAPFQVHEASISYTVKSPCIELEGTADITLKVGGSQIDIGADGINIVAPKITLKASGGIEMPGTPTVKVPSGVITDKNFKG